VEPLTRGLQPPDICSLCHLSSTKFVETPSKKKFLAKTPSEKNSWVRHCVKTVLSHNGMMHPWLRLEKVASGFGGYLTGCHRHCMGHIPGAEDV
jgi:hypothetical protein